MMTLASVQEQVNQASAIIGQILGHDLLAIHLYGSAVEGGLKPWSDIDLLVTARQPMMPEQRKTLMQTLLTVSAWPGTSARWRALEVTVVVHSAVAPWRFPPQREMQFGEWLREDIRAGIYDPAQPDCDLAILLTHVRTASIAVVGEPAGTLFEAVPQRDLVQTFRQTLELWQEPGDFLGDERNIILTLSRIWYSAVTGAFIAKDAAAEWLLPQLPAEHAALVQAAQREYLGQVAVDWTVAMPAVERFVHYAKAAIIERLPTHQ